MSDPHLLAGPDATRRAGTLLGGLVQPGDAIGLLGDLGAGKTLLVQGLGDGLAIPPSVRVTSPTFTLVNEYRGGRLTLFHADLYRIDHASELREIGLDDAFESGGVTAVEWCDRFDVMPADHLLIRLEVRAPDQRALTTEPTGARARALAAAWTAALRA